MKGGSNTSISRISIKDPSGSAAPGLNTGSISVFISINTSSLLQEKICEWTTQNHLMCGDKASAEQSNSNKTCITNIFDCIKQRRFHENKAVHFFVYNLKAWNLCQHRIVAQNCKTITTKRHHLMRHFMSLCIHIMLSINMHQWKQNIMKLNALHEQVCLFFQFSLICKTLCI